MTYLKVEVLQNKAPLWYYELALVASAYILYSLPSVAIAAHITMSASATQTNTLIILM